MDILRIPFTIATAVHGWRGRCGLVLDSHILRKSIASRRHGERKTKQKGS